MTQSSNSAGGTHRGLTSKMLAGFCVITGLVGFPLGVFVAASGSGLVAFGVYASAIMLTALGSAVWVAENIVNGGSKSEVYGG